MGEYSLFCRALLQKSPIFLRNQIIVATLHVNYECRRIYAQFAYSEWVLSVHQFLCTEIYTPFTYSVWVLSAYQFLVTDIYTQFTYSVWVLSVYLFMYTFTRIYVNIHTYLCKHSHVSASYASHTYRMCDVFHTHFY